MFCHKLLSFFFLSFTERAQPMDEVSSYSDNIKSRDTIDCGAQIEKVKESHQEQIADGKNHLGTPW